MNLIERLETKAAEFGINVRWAYTLNEYTPPSASTKHNCIVMNANWHKQSEIPFQLAHEIAHILNHDECDLAFYHASFASKERCECEANLGAIKLLLPIFNELGYENNPVKFMQIFNVPSYLFDNVVKMIKNNTKIKGKTYLEELT